MLIAVVIIGSLLCLLGLAGAVLPALPGAPLALAALFLLAWVTKCAPPLTVPLLMVMAIITAVAAVVDYILPIIGAKKFGATKWGIGGSIIGMILGFFFFPFFGLGLFIGAFVGAVAAELIGGKQHGAAFMAGVGTLIGTVLGLVVKLAATGVIAWYFTRAAWAACS